MFTISAKRITELYLRTEQQKPIFPQHKKAKILKHGKSMPELGKILSKIARGFQVS